MADLAGNPKEKSDDATSDRLAMPRGRADLRDHGAADWRLGRRADGDDVLSCARCITAKRNGRDVPLDERLPFDALAEADLQAAKRRFWPIKLGPNDAPLWLNGGPVILIRRPAARDDLAGPCEAIRARPRGGWHGSETVAGAAVRMALGGVCGEHVRQVAGVRCVSPDRDRGAAFRADRGVGSGRGRVGGRGGGVAATR